MTDIEEIRARYASRLAKDEESRARQLAGHTEVREGFTDLNMILEDILPEGRYKSLVITHLEIAAMFANKAVASPHPVVEAHKEGRQSLEMERLREGTQGLDAKVEGLSKWGMTAEEPSRPLSESSDE